MVKILVISNSFGTDATRYLHNVARNEGKAFKVVNLYIGGCSLYRHYRNMLADAKEYELQINGHSSGFYVSIKEALLSDEWDYVVTHQCSPKSGDPDSYFPYLEKLADYIREFAPKAKLLLQMTWTFAEGAPRFKLTSFSTRNEMIPAITDCYEAAAKRINADGIIPTHNAMCALYDIIGESTYRDGFHVHLGHTRYMIACLWYMMITGKDIRKPFYDFDVEVDPDIAQLCLDIARATIANHGVNLK